VEVIIGYMGDYRRDTFTGLAHYGDIEGIKELIDNPNGHSDIEADEGGIGFWGRAMTALGIAAKRGDIDMMRLLLREGSANPEGTGSHDNYYTATPLFAAVQARNIEAIEMLLNSNADVNSSASVHPETNGGATAMYYAATHGLLEIAMFLHSYGALLCIPTGRGDTPIDIAIKNGHTAFVHWTRNASTYFVPLMDGNDMYFGTVCHGFNRCRGHDQGIHSLPE
jgi:ankyrin repeat protein